MFAITYELPGTHSLIEDSPVLSLEHSLFPSDLIRVIVNYIFTADAISHFCIAKSAGHIPILVLHISEDGYFLQTLFFLPV